MAGRPPRKRRVPVKMGRKTLCTPSVIQRFAQAYAQGVSIEDAAIVAGVDQSTVHAWWKRGEKGEAPFVDFLKESMRAKAQAIEETALIVRNAAKDDWRAGMAWLERVAREQFGRQPEIDMRHQEQTIVVVRDLGNEIPIDAEVVELPQEAKESQS